MRIGLTLARALRCGVINRLEGIVRVIIVPAVHHRANGLLAATDIFTGLVIYHAETVIARLAVTVVPVQRRDATVAHGLAYITEIIETERLVGRAGTTNCTELAEIYRYSATDIHVVQAVQHAHIRIFAYARYNIYTGVSPLVVLG